MRPPGFLGPDHPDTLLMQVHVADDLFDLGRFAEAAAKRVADIRARILPATDWHIATMHGIIGMCLAHLLDSLAQLRPLNAYGWSKHLIDRRLARLVAK